MEKLINFLLDSFGKPSSGIFRGTIWFRGDYDQCLNIRNTENEEIYSGRASEIINGKYCALYQSLDSLKKETIEIISEQNNNTLIQLIEKFIKPFRLPQLLYAMKLTGRYKKGMRFDICIPSTCTDDDVENILKQLFKDGFSFEVEYCKTKEMKSQYTTVQLICIISFSLLITWVIFATIIEIMLKLHIIPTCKIEESILKDVISCSALTSGRNFFKSNILSEKTSSLCGIKTFISNAIVFGHIVVFLLPSAAKNYLNIIEMFNYIPLEIAFHSLIMIETFFFINGFSTLYFSKKERNFKNRYVVPLIKRIVRLTICVICIVGVIFILPLFSDGPNTDFVINTVQYTERNWWKYVLHIGNLFEIKPEIIYITWFIGALIQLNILGLPFIFILNRWPKYGQFCLVILILTGFMFYIEHIIIGKSYVMNGHSFDMIKFFVDFLSIHFKTYASHLSSYAFGLLIGSALSSKKELKFGKNIVVCFWIIAITLMSFTIFGLHNCLKNYVECGNLIIVHRILSPYFWTVGIAWVCVACITGYGGALNWFLSLKFFVIFDRLNIFVYLLHPIILAYIYVQRRDGIFISEMNLWMIYTFVICFTLIASFLFSIMVASPLNLLVEKLFNFKNMKKMSSSMEDCKLEKVTIKNISLNTDVVDTSTQM